MSGPGRYTLIWSHADGGAIRLWNFDIDRHNLKAEHTAGLAQWVLPPLKAGGSARIVGLTSRTGSRLHNKLLSERRAGEVVCELERQLGEQPRILATVGLGEESAEIAGEGEKDEDAAWRAVTVFYWRRPDPPPPTRVLPPPSMVQRHATKLVALPAKAAIAGGDAARAGGSEALVHTYAPVVREQDPVQVPDTYVVTRIDSAEESIGAHSVLKPGLGQEVAKAVAKPAHADTREFQCYRFRWGPPTKSVEVWEINPLTKRNELRERVSPTRAMWIYENPGIYRFRPYKGPK